MIAKLETSDCLTLIQFCLIFDGKNTNIYFLFASSRVISAALHERPDFSRGRKIRLISSPRTRFSTNLVDQFL